MICKGYNGQIEILDDKLLISRKGIAAKITHGGKGDKEIYISDIKNIEFNNATILKNGYIHFCFSEYDNFNGNHMAATNNEYAVLFTNTQQKEFEALKALLEKKINKFNGEIVTSDIVNSAQVPRDTILNVIKNETPKKIPSKNILVGAVVVLMLFVVIILTNSNTDNQTINANQTQTTVPSTNQPISLAQEKQPVENNIPCNLGLSPNEFKNRFNQAAHELQSDLRISGNLKVENGAVQDVFQYMLTSYLGLIGSVNKQDGRLRSVTIVGQGDGTIKSGIDIIISMGILIAAINPELSASERGDILKDLGIIGDNVDILDLSSNTIRNGKKYFVTSSKEIGVMFGVEDANDK